MTREDLTSQLLQAKEDNYLLELSTGYGKTKATLDKIQQWYTKDCKILVAVPKLVLIDGFKEECKKWDCEYLLDNITFTTYASFHKHQGNWNIIILDEAHHLSERCRDLLLGYNSKHIIALSATMKKDHKFFLQQYFYRRKKSYKIFEVKLSEAIENDVLPEPKLILFPLLLDNSKYTCEIQKNFKKGINKKPITIAYKDKFKFRTYKNPIIIKCTEKQYYDDISSLIDWYKQKAEHTPIMRQMWLHKCGDRLVWLAERKTDIIKKILLLIRNYRSLTFCARIEQSEQLGIPCVNSKIGTENLERFNNKKIKHIACVSQLDEGVNITDCRIGVFQMINSSSRLTVQRLGRIERHKEPVIIFPYYKNTREEEIVNNIVTEYKDINTITSINEIIKLLK